MTALHTGNAASNAHMLAINTEMGFRPTHLTGCWQAGLETVEAALSRRWTADGSAAQSPGAVSGSGSALSRLRTADGSEAG